MVDETPTVEMDPYDLTKLGIEWWPADKIKPYARNTKVHSREQVDKLKRSISEFGLFDPLIVDKEGVIIAGHGRFQALCELGQARSIPVRWAKHLSKNQADAARIAHNKTASNDYDSAFMAEELQRLSMENDVSLDALGLDLHELDFLTEDLGGFNADALADDLDAEIDEQDAETKRKVEEADGDVSPLVKVLGFKAIPVKHERLFRAFAAEIEAETGLTGADAWVEWLNGR